MKITYIRVLFFVAFLAVGPQVLRAQNTGLVGKVWNYMFNDTTDISKPKFLAYPTIAYAPETRWEFGVSALYVYYMNQDTTNRLSEVTMFSFLTLEKQYGIWMEHALYGDQSKWFFLGRMRIQRFPLLYFGTGPTINGEELAQIDAGSISIRERVLRRLGGSFYVGLETDFQRLANVEITDIAEGGFERPIGANPYTNIGLGIGLVYDDRHNVLNVREGFFGETGFLRYSDAWGSDFEFWGVYWDVRKFIPVTPDKKQVLALQGAGSFLNGDVPFNQLALLGGEVLMRGYYLGRYRDLNYAAAQVEYRFLPFPFSKRLGAAAFIGAGMVAPTPGDFNLSKFLPSGGAGIRFLLFPQKDIYVRFDVGFTPEGSGIYFFTGEAF